MTVDLSPAELTLLAIPHHEEKIAHRKRPSFQGLDQGADARTRLMVSSRRSKATGFVR